MGLPQESSGSAHRCLKTAILTNTTLAPVGVTRTWEDTMRNCAFIFLFTTTAAARTAFWAPVAPPRAHYSIDLRFAADTSRLEGTETIRFRNNTLRPIGQMASDGGSGALPGGAENTGFAEYAAQSVQSHHRQEMG